VNISLNLWDVIGLHGRKDDGNKSIFITQNSLTMNTKTISIKIMDFVSRQ